MARIDRKGGVHAVTWQANISSGMTGAKLTNLELISIECDRLNLELGNYNGTTNRQIFGPPCMQYRFMTTAAAAAAATLKRGAKPPGLVSYVMGPNQ